MATEGGEFNSEVLQSFVQFLSKSSPLPIRGMAMDYLLGCTGTRDGIEFIGNNSSCLKSVMELTDDDDINISKTSFKILINLTAELETAVKIADSPDFGNFIVNLLQLCLSADSINAYSASKVASNLSRWEPCSAAIKKACFEESNSKVSVNQIVEAFSKRPDTLEYLANFLSNMSCQQEIRTLILDKKRCIIQRLLPLLSSDSSVVRQGMAATLKNCCFETDYHEWLLSPEIDLLPRLLLPLAGPEEFDEDDMEKLPDDLQYLGDDKTREPEERIRHILIETINKLCATKVCRHFVKDKNTYVIVRELHKWEKSPVVLAAIENLVSVLISDEPEEGMENLENVVIPEHIEEKLMQLDRQ